MVKNTKGGKGQKKFGRKFTLQGGNKTLRESKEEGELYACVSRVLGNNMAHIITQHNKTMLLHIRNKFRGRSKRDNIIAVGTYVLAGERTFETIKSDKLSNCDLLEVYNDGEVDRLKKENPDIPWIAFKTIVNPISKEIDEGEGVQFVNIDEEAENIILEETKQHATGELLDIGGEEVDFNDI
jgi:translation initiation factor IF-1|tara:strand:- start:1340 stop:1888 length:549 start_codon:yes stop_codon:yes gene_type:complete